MSVGVQRTDDAVVLLVAGELDVATADVPVGTARRALAAGDPARLVVDLAGVTFIGSSGVGALVRIRNLCHDAGVALRLRGLRPQARKILVLTGLDRAFDVAADTTS